MGITITKILVLFVFNFSIVSSAKATVSKRTKTSNHTDLQAAIEDMRAKSFYGFAILLQMINTTTQHNLKDVTFFVPRDSELSSVSIPANRLDAFVLSHLIVMPLQFDGLVRFPTGSVVPSGYHNRMIRIYNHGNKNFVVNNAVVDAPNVCSSSKGIKCHGVNKVIHYGDDI